MRTVLISALLFFTLSVSAQDQGKKEKNGRKKEARTNVTVTTTPPSTIELTGSNDLNATTPSTVALTQRNAEAAPPTPEEQGYTKQIVGGKEVYVKQAGSMTFYYEPKK